MIIFYHSRLVHQWHSRARRQQNDHEFYHILAFFSAKKNKNWKSYSPLGTWAQASLNFEQLYLIQILFSADVRSDNYQNIYVEHGHKKRDFILQPRFRNSESGRKTS